MTATANSGPLPVPAGTDAAVMTLAQRSDLVLGGARVLYANGQTTDQTLAAAERLADAVGLQTTVVPRWGELQLQAEDGDARLVSVVKADPSGVHMTRAASVDRTIEDLQAGRLTPVAARQKIEASSKAPPLPDWLFALAAGIGALSLAMIYGLNRFGAGVLIFVSALAGGFLRRQLSRRSTNVYLQPFAAALLAGVVGALAVKWGLS